jgi:hypothetical protein
MPRSAVAESAQYALITVPYAAPFRPANGLSRRMSTSNSRVILARVISSRSLICASVGQATPSHSSV